MKIEILYSRNCPNFQPTLDLLNKALIGRRIRIPVETVLIDSEEEAARKQFLGSPTIRFDGEDIDPATQSQTDYGLKCRIYLETGQGVPSQEMLELALDQAQKKRRLQKEAPLN